MRHRVPDSLERGRIVRGPQATDATWGFNGAFLVHHKSVTLRVIISDGLSGLPQDAGWEHCSVSLSDRTPRWDEMCAVRDLVWGEDETVVQYHPRASVYRNYHPYCLHMWRPIGVEVPEPHPELVAPAP